MSVSLDSAAAAKPDIRDVPVGKLTAVAQGVGLKAFGAAQLYQWIYQQGVEDFAAMTNLPKAVRAALADRYSIAPLPVATAETASDGTTKFLFALRDGRQVETVMIPAQRRDHVPRRTVCISTQVGCAMGCTFCRTGTMGLMRNLSQGEIIAQVMAIKKFLAAKDERLTNVVLMGMGEPLHNYQATVDALRIITDDKGVAMAKRRVTVSTVGLVPAIRRFAYEGTGVKLALSLHATTDEQRQTLIPLAKKYPLAEVLDACHEYCRAQGGGERVTFEYLMLSSVNDTAQDAKRLVRLASQVPSKVNLIPLNPYPGCPWERPEDARIERFANWLREKAVQVNIRHSRGSDILAACGQLATERGGA